MINSSGRKWGMECTTDEYADATYTFLVFASHDHFAYAFALCRTILPHFGEGNNGGGRCTQMKVPKSHDRIIEGRRQSGCSPTHESAIQSFSLILNGFDFQCPSVAQIVTDTITAGSLKP